MSGGRRDLIELDLTTTGLRPHVGAIWGDGDVAHPKPYGRALVPALRWLARQGIATDQVVAIGDHPRDRQAAWSHGLRFVAVLSGASRTGDFPAGGAGRWETVRNLDELVDRCHSPGSAQRDPDRPTVG